jgi:hypothetical protein
VAPCPGPSTQWCARLNASANATGSPACRAWPTTASGLVAVAALVPSLALAGTAGAIVGGGQIQPSFFPTYTRILLDRAINCGGTVIGPDRVLTAAHCVSGLDPGRLTVLVHDALPEIPVAGITVHPLWNGTYGDGHDLAVIALPAGSTAGVTPIQVGTPFSSSVYAAGTPAWILGHGATVGGGPGTAELRAANVPIRSDDDMGSIYDPWWEAGFGSWDSTLMIGAGSENTTACHGDSGGPLIVFQGTHQIQVGVGSFVRTWPSDCAQPAGFAKLSGPQLAWVASQVHAVIDGWGACTMPSGHPGLPFVNYQSWFLAGGATDGPFYWAINCYLPPVVASPTPSRTPSDPDGTFIPPVCRVTPWKCTDL